jgi:hypothetical protein
VNGQIDHLRQTLHDLMQWIAAERLEATVIGGVAAGLHGQPRLTEDVEGNWGQAFECRS